VQLPFVIRLVEALKVNVGMQNQTGAQRYALVVKYCR
jgi:hypothetical protein